MKTCYLIQSHRDREQIVRLARTLRRSSPSAEIVVAHDSTGCALDAADFAGVGLADFFRFDGPAVRGTLSLLEPYFQALERLSERSLDVDWLVYLSAQDYPVRPLDRSEAFLAASGRDGFLTFADAFSPDNPLGRPKQGLLRYTFQYRTLPDFLRPLARALRFINGLQPWMHLHTTYQARFGLRSRHSPFGATRRCYVGSQWTTLSRACTDFLRVSWRDERALVDYYRRTVCPDESLVQTLLVNSGRFKLTNDNLRYAATAGSRDGHPRTLTSDDLPMLRDGPWHFARKFDRATDEAALDRLDEGLFG